MLSFESHKPITFILPAVFLLIMGIGNLSIGVYKRSQYESTIRDLSLEKPKTKLLDNASPLRRIEYEKTTANRLNKRQARAKGRRDFYRLVSFGGIFFIALSFIFFSLGLCIKIYNKNYEH